MEVKIEIISEEYDEVRIFNSLEKAAEHLIWIQDMLCMDAAFQKRKEEEDAFAEASYMQLDERINNLGNNLLNRVFQVLPPRIKENIIDAPRCEINEDNIIVDHLSISDRILASRILVHQLSYPISTVSEGMLIDIEQLKIQLDMTDEDEETEKEKLSRLSLQLKQGTMTPKQIAMAI